ncbi:MAG: hypothetical protein SV375_10395, partial [Thermodesulfobacteriota bacterium]|nr:hypothetical protein [Thermodesulfobacteriota bacterium]
MTRYSKYIEQLKEDSMMQILRIFIMLLFSGTATLALSFNVCGEESHVSKDAIKDVLTLNLDECLDLAL